MQIGKVLGASTLFAGLLAFGGQAQSAPFTYLHPDFTQELIVSTNAPGSGGGVAGVTLGLDGYLYTNDAGGSVVQKWDPNNRVLVGGTMVSSHVATLSSSSYNGWGITTDSSGAIYALDTGSLNQVNTTTLAPTYVGPAGTYGLAYEAGKDTFLSSTGNDIIRTTKAGLSSTVVGAIGTFIDQVAIDPTGQFIAGAALNINQVRLWNANTGALVASANVGHRPDGIAFDNLGNIFTNNTDGTVTRIEFGSGYAAGATGNTLIASGGFYGDLAGVGSDGSFYLSQYGTRFDNGSTNSSTSIVKLSFASSTGGSFVDGGSSSVPEPGIIGLVALPLLAFGFTAKQRKAS